MIRTCMAVLFVAIFLAATSAFPFGAEGCGAGECVDCHSLSREQVMDIMAELNSKAVVDEVVMSEVPGLWSIIMKRPNGVKVPVFLDFSLSYIIQGEAIKISSKENITRSRVVELNKIDTETIPLDDAIVLGKPDAKYKIIVFDDPECSYCSKLHEVMKKIVNDNEDFAFFIKMLPLEIHPAAYDKAKAIICEKSAELLEKTLAGEEIDPPKCETDQIEKNRVLAKKLKIRSTPTLIFPDGRVYPGFKSAEKIYEFMDADTKVNKKK